MDNFKLLALRTEAAVSPELLQRNNANVRIIHGVLGLASEVGELHDAVKKSIFYNKDLDIVNIKEELGDLLWYMALIMDVVGASMEECQELVIAKLRTRYPEKFTEDKAINRDLTAERKILEGANVI